VGATIYLKEVAKGGVHRFTLRASDRDLKLRAPEVKTYGEWMAALRHRPSTRPASWSLPRRIPPRTARPLAVLSALAPSAARAGALAASRCARR